MKNAFDKLFSLLGCCSENPEESSKLQLLVQITQSIDYKALSGAAALKKPFDEYYSLPKLEALERDDLKKRAEMIHKLVSFHSQLLQCIRSGNGPELSASDLPDFTSKKSISRLLDKISLSHRNVNYSNIGEADALALFSDSTIRSAQGLLDMLPVSCAYQKSLTEEDINKYMTNTLYCVPMVEFERVHQDFRTFAQKGEIALRIEKTRRKKHLLLKIATVMVCFGAAFGFSQFGLLSDSFLPVLYTIILVASIVFMIWG